MANLILNPSFETDLSHWEAEGAYSRSNVAAQDGSYSLRYQGTSFENFITKTSEGIDVLSNTQYTLTFYYKGTITTGNAPTVQINRDGPYGTTITSQYMGSSASFAQKTITFTTPSGVTKVWIRIFGGAGTVDCYFDNFSLPEPVTTGNILYRGVNISGLEFGSSFPGTEGTDYFSSANGMFSYVSNKRLNVVRIPFRAERIQTTPGGSLNSTYLSQINDQVTKAINNGLKVILDCHNYGRVRVTSNGGFTDNFSDPNSTNFSGGYLISGGVMTGNQFTRVLCGTTTNPASPATTYKVTLDAKITSNGGSDLWRELWIEVYRASDTNKYFLVMNNLSGVIALRKVVNNTTTTLQSKAYTINVGTFYTVIIDVGQETAGTIKVKIGGVTELSGAVDAALTGGQVGIYGSGVNWAIDNFTLNVAGDTTSGGTTERIIGDTNNAYTVANFADMWDKISEQFKNNTGVLGYDLMNEPHDMPTATTSSNYKTTATATLMYQAAVDAIRANNDDKYCIVELDHWANIHTFTSTYGTNPDPWITDTLDKVVYSAHSYWDSAHSGSYAGGWDSDSRLSALHEEVVPFFKWCQDKGKKCFIGEFGTPSDDDRWLSVLYTFYKYADDYNVWGMTYWALGDPYVGPVTSAQPTSTYTVDSRQMQVIALYPGGVHTQYTGGLNYKFTGGDTMPWSKDSMRGHTDAGGGYTLAQIDRWMALIKEMGFTHVPIECPLDDWTVYPVSQGMDSNSGINYLRNWVDMARKNGLSVEFRNCFIGSEGLYGANIETYSIRAPGVKTQEVTNLAAGSFLKKYYDFIITNGNLSKTYGRLIEENDKISFAPEPTSYQFQSGGVWPGAAAGQTEAFWQSNSILSQWYFDLKIVMDIALTKIGRRGVYTGYSTCTFSELNSGYISTIFYQGANRIVPDHYDSNATTWMSSIISLHNAKSFLGTYYKTYIGEFGDIYNTNDTEAKALLVKAYLTQIDSNKSKIEGFTYWAVPGALVNSNTFTLTQAGRVMKTYLTTGVLTDGSVTTPTPPTTTPRAWTRKTKHSATWTKKLSNF